MLFLNLPQKRRLVKSRLFCYNKKMLSQIKNAFTKVYKKKYYDYNNNSWLEKALPSIRLYQSYRRHSGNPLSNFLTEAEDKINNFIIYYTTYVAQQENDEIQKLREDLRSLYRRFYNEFIANKNIIDTTIDPATGEYMYDGGDTTATFSFQASMVISEKFINQIIRNKSKYNNKSKDYTFLYKIENLRINSNRW